MSSGEVGKKACYLSHGAGGSHIFCYKNSDSISGNSQKRRWAVEFVIIAARSFDQSMGVTVPLKNVIFNLLSGYVDQSTKFSYDGFRRSTF